MSAEEMQRARDIITALCETHVFLADDLSPIAEQDLADLIASAIREAEASATTSLREQINKTAEVLIAAGRYRSALEVASVAFEMMDPANHGQTSDTEFARLMDAARKAVDEALAANGGRHDG